MKIRSCIESNYKSMFFNGKTIRSKLDSKLPFKAPKTPEIEDVAINTLCYANCSYCYTSALKTGNNFTDIVEKSNLVWGSLPESERPFQIAIGGAGESTLHPDWVEFVKNVHELGIMPNYTTNGMHLSKEILQATADYCGGVALSYHPHLTGVFDKAMNKLVQLSPNLKLNTHVIVGDDQSLNDLQEIYFQWGHTLDYLVILPYQVAGRAKYIDTHSTWIKMFEWISSLSYEEQRKFAFGALFHEWLTNNKPDLDMSIYDPEIFSGYRLMDESYETLRKSSYDLSPKIV